MLASPPFAPSTLSALQALGIHNRALLQETGAVRTFLLLKAAGHTFTRSVLWQLAAEVRGISVRELSEADRQMLLQQLKQHPPVALPPAAEEARGHMRRALAQAEAAAAAGEIPVGAVVVRDGVVLAEARNGCIGAHDISAHAEIRALAAAGAATGNYRLEGCDVYITLEPCAMCSSALLQARVRRVVFGAYEPKTGAAGSVIDLFADTRLNRHTAVFGGVEEAACQNLMQRFFAQKR